MTPMRRIFIRAIHCRRLGHARDGDRTMYRRNGVVDHGSPSRWIRRSPSNTSDPGNRLVETRSGGSYKPVVCDRRAANLPVVSCVHFAPAPLIHFQRGPVRVLATRPFSIQRESGKRAS